ncbi:MAG: hypothetical protein KGI58_03780 [Patescibacteria group bacterium]|nr:hypothetical protein [Patescibacteria group bacterium]
MNTRKVKNIVINVAIISGVLIFSPHTASALSVSPPRVELQGNPGQTITQDMTLTNDTKSTEIFYSSFANFEAQGETGNPAFVQSKDDLDTWMTTEKSVALKAGQSIIVPVKINIPDSADPGGHFAAVFWGTAPTTVGSSAVSIGAKVGMLILLSVAGDVKEAGGLLSFSTANNQFWYNTLPVSFEYRFKNDGGDRIKPIGQITIHDMVYLPADRLDANIGEGNVLPSSTRRFNVDWIKNPRSKDYVAPTGMFAKFFDQALYEWKNFAVGPYLAKLDLIYGTGAIHTGKSVFIFVFPWQLLICLTIIFIIVFWGGRKLIRRYNNHIIQKARAGMNTPNDANHV